MGVDVNDTELKKAYRKAAMKVCVVSHCPVECSLSSQYHPDKNSSPDAEEKFKDIRCGIFGPPSVATRY